MTKKDKEIDETKVNQRVKTIQQKSTPVVTAVYAGNSFLRGALQQFSVFKNGIPKTLEKDIEKCPAIAQLMVPISKLAETRANLSVQGSREHTLNAQIQSYVRGEK